MAVVLFQSVIELNRFSHRLFILTFGTVFLKYGLGTGLYYFNLFIVIWRALLSKLHHSCLCAPHVLYDSGFGPTVMHKSPLHFWRTQTVLHANTILCRYLPYLRSCPIENSHLPDGVLEQSNGTFLLERRLFPCHAPNVVRHVKFSLEGQWRFEGSVPRERTQRNRVTTLPTRRKGIKL